MAPIGSGGAMRVAVLGGGIQGCTVALELAHRGADVELFEAGTDLMKGASRHNEGKVHLGYVYSADDTLRSACLMMRGAAVFFPLLRRWVGSALDTVPVSSTFNYAVHRESQRDISALTSTYSRIAALLRDVIPDDRRYPAPHPACHIRRLERDECKDYGWMVDAVFETSEIAVDPDGLSEVIAHAVTDLPDITVHTGTSIRSIDPGGQCVVAAVDGESPRVRGPFDHVVNCTWSSRPALDASIGIPPAGPWSFRMKYFVRTTFDAGEVQLPSTTVVLGPFGDIVDLGDCHYHFSWYPAGRRGWSRESVPPAWPTVPDADELRSIVDGTFAGLSDIVPAIGALAEKHWQNCAVRGGIIFALGDTDISDPTSYLHQRHAVGPATHGAYHSVDTGKLTLAPLFAVEVADRILGARRG